MDNCIGEMDITPMIGCAIFLTPDQVLVFLETGYIAVMPVSPYKL